MDVRHPAPDLVGTRALKSGHMRCLLSGVSQSPLSSSPAQGPIPSSHHLQCPPSAHLLFHPTKLQTTSSFDEGSLLFFSCQITGMWPQHASIHLALGHAQPTSDLLYSGKSQRELVGPHQFSGAPSQASQLLSCLVGNETHCLESRPFKNRWY